jgi:hypothetical protein
MRGDYQHLALYPPQIYHGGCGAPFNELYVYRLAYVAYRVGLTINSGYLARYPPEIREICTASERDVAERRLDDQTVYIPSSPQALPEGAAICGQLDGYDTCVAAGRSTPFSRALSR